MKHLLTAAATLALLAVPAMADCPTSATVGGNTCESGRVVFDATGPNCYKVHIAETGNKYAVMYGFTTTTAQLLANGGYVSALQDGGARSIVSDGRENTICDQAGYLNIIGVRQGSN